MPDNADIADLNPAFRAKLDPFLNGLANAGINAKVISGYRSPELQQKLYQNFQAAQAGRPLPYPHDGSGGIAAPAWNSFHNFGLAADVVPANAADYPRMWGLAAQYGLTPLAQKDKPHIQMPGSLSDNIAQFNLAEWRPASQPAPAQGAIAYAAPSQTVMPDEARAMPARPATPTPGPVMFGGLNPDARGMRNNNPGNLIANEFTAGLPGYKGTDGKFAIFDTPEHGAAALDRNLTSYGSKGINTPLGIASTWAPASDNNDPKSYGAQIAKSLGVGPNDKIDLSDPAVRTKVSQAIGLVENGPGNSQGFRTAYTGAGPTTPGTTINTVPAIAGGGGSILPGFSDAKTSDKFQKDLQTAFGQPDSGKDDQTPSAPPMQLMRDARNTSPLGGAMLPMSSQLQAQITGYQPQAYGHTLTSIADPTQWGSAPPGSMPGAQTGQQAPAGTASPYGTSLAGLQMAYGLSPQQLQMMMNPMMLNQGGSFG